MSVDFFPWALKLALCASLVGAAVPLAAQEGSQSNGEQSAQDVEQQQIKQGRYLVHHVAKCVECHSPRNPKGQLIERRLLMGAKIPLASPYPEQVWAFRAPQIAGLPGWTDQEIEVLLSTGARPDGHRPRAPMPSFRMKPADAQAVVAYLRSLTR